MNEYENTLRKSNVGTFSKIAEGHFKDFTSMIVINSDFFAHKEFSLKSSTNYVLIMKKKSSENN